VPDGVTLDADGGYIVSCYYPYHVYRVPPSGGTPELLLDDATGTRFPMPTNTCFFGERLTTLAIVSLGGHNLCAVNINLKGVTRTTPRRKVAERCSPRRNQSAVLSRD
jgi:sugar lactone lactonase YvrE